jgi:endonuclease/exonuclease/phosphatase family metal-dependent hydrolase
MRFLLYNVRYGAGSENGFHFPLPWMGYLRRNPENLQRITEFIASQRADIVGLVEVDSGSIRSDRENQAEVIANAVGHYHCHRTKYAGLSLARLVPIVNKQANAFLTNDVAKVEKFHYFDKGIKRLVIELEMENLTVFLVHLSLRYRHRREQLHDLCRLLNSVSKPHMVAGDFNIFWGDREINWFLTLTGLASANRSRLPSYPSRAPRRELDFILHSPEIRITRFETLHVLFSDHLPLVCDFEIG